MLAEIGAEYVRQVVDLSPDQRKRYLAQVCSSARGGHLPPGARIVEPRGEADAIRQGRPPPTASGISRP